VCNERLRLARGCYGRPQVSFEFEGERLKRCPLKVVQQGSWELLALYQHYRRGFLLSEGGLLHQPYKYLEAMRLIEDEVVRLVQEKKIRAEGGRWSI